MYLSMEANMLDYNIIASLNSNLAIMFTFGLVS